MSNLEKKDKPKHAFPVEEYNELSQYVLKKAKEKGMDEVEVAFSMSEGLSTSVRLQQVETIEYCKDRGLGISVYYKKQKGQASSTDTSLKAIDDAINAACDIAKATGKDECFGLADKSLMANDYPELDLYHPWDISHEKAIAEMIACEALAMDNEKIKTSEGAALSTGTHYMLYANSHGFSGEYMTSRHGFHCSLVTEDANKEMHRDYGYTNARKPELLGSVTAVAKEAQKKTLSRLGARKIKTQKAPVIFSNEVSSGLLGSLIAAISGGNLYKKTTFLLDSMGQQVLPSRFKVYESPHTKGALGSSPFDGDGLLTRNNVFIDEGKVCQYVLGSYSARRLGLESSANAGGVHNLQISTDDLTFEELLMVMGEGLLVTELIGQGVNMTTGLYSRGAFGYWIKDGKIDYPVHEITIAGNLKDMFMDIGHIANDIDSRKATKCGAVLIPSMSIAGS